MARKVIFGHEFEEIALESQRKHPQTRLSDIFLISITRCPYIWNCWEKWNFVIISWVIFSASLHFCLLDFQNYFLWLGLLAKIQLTKRLKN